MESNKRIVRLSGILFVILFLISSIAAGLAGSVGDYNIRPEEIGSLLNLIAEHKVLHMAEIGFDFFSYIITIVLGAILFVAFSPDNRPLALLGTIGIICGAVTLAVHDIPHFVLPWIAESFVSANAASAMALQHLGNVTLMTAMWGLSIGVTFLGLGFLAYGVLFIKSKSVPTIFGWVGAISGILLSAGVWLPRYNESLYPLFVMLASPLGIWQLTLGIWLIVKGVNSEINELTKNEKTLPINDNLG